MLPTPLPSARVHAATLPQDLFCFSPTPLCFFCFFLIFFKLSNFLQGSASMPAQNFWQTIDEIPPPMWDFVFKTCLKFL